MKNFYLLAKMFLAFTLFTLAFSACTCKRQNGQNDREQEIISSVNIEDQLLQDFNKSKLIFYSLPSPLETAMLIKRSGATFNQGLLNSLDNIGRYNTNLKMALNLGVYTTNMSYASLFDQVETTLAYMGNARQLAERLGIVGAIDEYTIRRLQENMNNRDVVIEIISETFMNSNAYLAEQGRSAIAAMVLVGGWVEGLYIATQLTGGSLDLNPQLVDRIVYQKLSLQTLISMLEAYQDNADIQYLMTKMLELKTIYDEVKIVTTSEVEAETIPERQLTILRSEAETFITAQTFRRLVEKVKEIRTGFIS